MTSDPTGSPPTPAAGDDAFTDLEMPDLTLKGVMSHFGPSNPPASSTRPLRGIGRGLLWLEKRATAQRMPVWANRTILSPRFRNTGGRMLRRTTVALFALLIATPLTCSISLECDGGAWCQVVEPIT